MFKKGFSQGLGMATGAALVTLATGGITYFVVKRKMKKTGEKIAKSLTGAVTNIAANTANLDKE